MEVGGKRGPNVVGVWGPCWGEGFSRGWVELWLLLHGAVVLIVGLVVGVRDRVVVGGDQDAILVVEALLRVDKDEFASVVPALDGTSKRGGVEGHTGVVGDVLVGGRVRSAAPDAEVLNCELEAVPIGFFSRGTEALGGTDIGQGRDGVVLEFRGGKTLVGCDLRVPVWELDQSFLVTGSL